MKIDSTCRNTRIFSIWGTCLNAATILRTGRRNRAVEATEPREIAEFGGCRHVLELDRAGDQRLIEGLADTLDTYKRRFGTWNNIIKKGNPDTLLLLDSCAKRTVAFNLHPWCRTGEKILVSLSRHDFSEKE